MSDVEMVRQDMTAAVAADVLWLLRVAVFIGIDAIALGIAPVRNRGPTLLLTWMARFPKSRYSKRSFNTR